MKEDFTLRELSKTMTLRRFVNFHQYSSKQK
jgi:hypothetical protein